MRPFSILCMLNSNEDSSETILGDRREGSLHRLPETNNQDVLAGTS